VSSSWQIVVRHLWVLRARRPWMLLAHGVFEPFLYLISFGLGIGQLIGALPGSAADVSYAAFVAPALLATSAMNNAVAETTGGVWFRLRFEKIYDAIVTTPVAPAEIARGEAMAAVLRSTLSAACFLLVILLLGLVRSWWALLALPALVLVAFGFAGVGLAVATYLKQMHHQQYIQLVMLPMFLFATTFYPLSVYPAPVRAVVAVLPLYQSTELVRGLVLGQIGTHVVVALVYLLVMGVAGSWIAGRRFAGALLR
jgi:lipooligosaccharide transport system permease protein